MDKPKEKDQQGVHYMDCGKNPQLGLRCYPGVLLVPLATGN